LQIPGFGPGILNVVTIVLKQAKLPADFELENRQILLHFKGLASFLGADGALSNENMSDSLV
jgi:hypothetical protein